jgi:hypothetical protein
MVFCFESIRAANPPDQKGVYAIRVRQRGENPERMIAQLQLLIKKLNWKTVSDFFSLRISRLSRISDCKVIYIGSNRNKSKNTLKDRYVELSNRHTIMYPLWALVYYGWDLEYGWRVTDNPERLEAQLKQQYQKLHGGHLPALVDR